MTAGVDNSEAWVLSAGRNNMPADAVFLPLDSAFEEYTCPWTFAECGRDFGPLECAVEKREWSPNSTRQESDGVMRCLRFRSARDHARPDFFSCRATSKGLFSVLERSRRAVLKSSSEARVHGLIFTMTLECNAGKTFGFSIQKSDAWIIPETSDPAPHAVVAPVDEEVGRAEQPIPPPAAPEAAAAPRAEETQGTRLEREACDLAAAWQSSRQLGQPFGEGGLSSGSNVEDMRNRLKALGAPMWCTKAQMWHRLVHTETRRELRKCDEAWLADRARGLAEAGGQGELRVQRSPEEPSLDERAGHEVTHRPYEPWCAWCVMWKGRAKSQMQRPVESVKVLEFEMDFCYLLQDPKKRHQLGDQAWATTLVIVDVAAQSPMCVALSTKSDENAYLSALRTAFVKRMAYAKAVLKVDLEPR